MIFSLQFQQNSLCFQSSGKACQGTIAADNAMAGDKDADAVGSDCSSHGSDTIGIAYTLSDFLIASGFTVWYIKQCIPYFSLEICSYRMQRNFE